MKLLSSIYNCILLFLLFLFSGILFGNIILVSLAIIPFLVFFAGILLTMPGDINVKRIVVLEKVYVNSILEVKIRVFIKSGIGLVTISDVIPDGFILDSGNNIFIVWKGIRDISTEFSYSLRCITQGEYNFNRIRIEKKHCLFNNSQDLIFSAINKIVVIPRTYDADTKRNPHLLSVIPMPINSYTRFGMPTLEFNDIRPYSYGDSFKHINWKASSRSILRGGFWPVINEYEKESRKEVWILLDTGKNMHVGSNRKTALDYGLEAVCSLSGFYLKQQCSTAFCTFDVIDSFVSPDSGNEQYHRIMKKAMRINTSNKGGKKARNLKETVIAHRSYFFGSKPLFIIITRLVRSNLSNLLDGMREMSKYTSTNIQNCQIVLLNIDTLQLAAETEYQKYAAEILRLKNRSFSMDLVKRCRMYHWDPLKGDVIETFLNEAR